MATQQEIIKRFMKALDTHKLNWSDKDFYKKILDDAIEYATSGSSRHFSTIAEAITAMKADIRSTNNADTFLKGAKARRESACARPSPWYAVPRSVH